MSKANFYLLLPLLLSLHFSSSQGSYVLVETGTCESVANRVHLTDMTSCEAGKVALSVCDMCPEFSEEQNTEQQPRCFLEGDMLVLNTHLTSTTACGEHTASICFAAQACTATDGSTANPNPCICNGVACTASNMFCSNAASKNCALVIAIPSCLIIDASAPNTESSCMCGASSCTVSTGMHCLLADNFCVPHHTSNDGNNCLNKNKRARTNRTIHRSKKTYFEKYSRPISSCPNPLTSGGKLDQVVQNGLNASADNKSVSGFLKFADRKVHAFPHFLSSSTAKADADTGLYASSNSKKQQIISISGMSPETGQNTEARVVLTTPDVELPPLLNNEKDEAWAEALQLTQKSQEKSPEEDRKMTMPKTTHKNVRSPQRLAKSKTAKFKLKTQLKQAELALIESQSQHDLCKMPLCFLLL